MSGVGGGFDPLQQLLSQLQAAVKSLDRLHERVDENREDLTEFKGEQTNKRQELAHTVERIGTDLKTELERQCTAIDTRLKELEKRVVPKAGKPLDLRVASLEGTLRRTVNWLRGVGGSLGLGIADKVPAIIDAAVKG